MSMGKYSKIQVLQFRHQHIFSSKNKFPTHKKHIIVEEKLRASSTMSATFLISFISSLLSRHTET